MRPDTLNVLLLLATLAKQLVSASINLIIVAKKNKLESAVFSDACYMHGAVCQLVNAKTSYHEKDKKNDKIVKLLG